MLIIDKIIECGKNIFKLKVLNFDIFDILFTISQLPGFPKIPDTNEPYGLDNYGIISVTDKSLVFYCYDELDPPQIVTVELKNGVPTITNSGRLNIGNPTLDPDNIINIDDVYELFGLVNL